MCINMVQAESERIDTSFNFVQTASASKALFFFVCLQVLAITVDIFIIHFLSFLVSVNQSA